MLRMAFLAAVAASWITVPVAAQQCGVTVAAAPGVKDGVSLCGYAGSGRLLAWRGSSTGNGTRIFLSYLDSTGAVGSLWPVGGLRLLPAGIVPIRPFLAQLSESTAMVVWSDLGEASNGQDCRFGAILTSNGSAADPSAVSVDTVTDRAGSQVPVGIVRQDDQHALVVLNDNCSGPCSGSTRALIKQVTIPGRPPGPWPLGGVVIADDVAEFPGGLAPVACCTDDSAGCLLLTAGNVPIDDFHFRTVFRLFRLLSDGSRDLRWPEGGLDLTADGDEFNLINELVADGKGGAYAAWTTGNHSPAGLVRVILQHVDGDGAIHSGWEPGGKLAMPAVSTTFQWYPRMARDSAGGIVLLLEDSEAQLRLRAFAADGSAGLGWPDSGLAVAGMGASWTLISGTGRLLIEQGSILAAWSATLPSSGTRPQLLGLALDFSANVLPGWPATGQTLCPSDGADLIQELAADSPVSFSVAWVRASDELLFARFSLEDGVVPVTAVARLVGYSLVGSILRAQWTFAGSAGRDLIGLMRTDGKLERRGLVEQIGRDLYSLSDTVPTSRGPVEYMLGEVSQDGFQVISDVLNLEGSRERAGFALGLEAVQSGRVLSIRLDLNAAADVMELSVHDLCGRSIAARRLERLVVGTQFVALEVPNARPGILFVRARTQAWTETARTVLLK